MDADGQNLVLLTGGGAISPSWSPDGMRIAYQADSCAWMMNTSGGGIKKIVYESGLSARRLDWSPDGSKIVYSDCKSNDICIVNIDGSGFRYVTNDPVGDCTNPAWSPDGTKILFEYRIPSETYAYRPYKINIDGSNRIRLLPEQPTVSGNQAWSPDGTQIVILLNSTNGYNGFLIVNEDGTNPTKMPCKGKSLYSKKCPSWSPDGEKIVFCDYDGIFTLTLSDTSITCLLNDDDLINLYP